MRILFILLLSLSFTTQGKSLNTLRNKWIKQSQEKINNLEKTKKYPKALAMEKLYIKCLKKAYTKPALQICIKNQKARLQNRKSELKSEKLNLFKRSKEKFLSKAKKSRFKSPKYIKCLEDSKTTKHLQTCNRARLQEMSIQRKKMQKTIERLKKLESKK